MLTTWSSAPGNIWWDFKHLDSCYVTDHSIAVWVPASSVGGWNREFELEDWACRDNRQRGPGEPDGRCRKEEVNRYGFLLKPPFEILHFRTSLLRDFLHTWIFKQEYVIVSNSISILIFDSTYVVTLYFLYFLVPLVHKTSVRILLYFSLVPFFLPWLNSFY